METQKNSINSKFRRTINVIKKKKESEKSEKFMKKYDSNDFDENGTHKVTFTRCNPNGFDRDGFYSDSFDKNGIHKYTFTRYNFNGFDRDGFDRNGRDKDGFDRDGFDRNRFDGDGFDRNDFDRNGLIEIVFIEKV